MVLRSYNTTGIVLQSLVIMCSALLHLRSVAGFQSISRQFSVAYSRAIPNTPRWFATTTSPPKFLFMATAIEDDETETIAAKSLESTWNVPGLKKEVGRLVMRSHKKVAKANTRLTNALETVDKLTSDPDVTMEQLEQCPSIDAIEFELQQIQERLQKLNELEEQLQSISKKKVVLPESIAGLALELGVNDEPPPRQPRGPTKKKGPRNKVSTRLPYRRYYTANKTEIRVGKKAEDNDQLSCSPEHRDGSDWWMHAAGCPGSHVVIRCGDSSLDNEVVEDAAALAARQSKCNGSVIKVNLCRCRNVKKPPGAKAGLVQLNGDVRTIVVKMKEAETRLRRLDDTVLWMSTAFCSQTSIHKQCQPPVLWQLPLLEARPLVVFLFCVVLSIVVGTAGLEILSRVVTLFVAVSVGFEFCTRHEQND